MSQAEMTKQYVTVAEFAAVVDVEPATVYGWISNGYVKAIRTDGPNGINGKRQYRKTRISQREVERVQKRLNSGLPIG